MQWEGLWGSSSEDAVDDPVDTAPVPGEIWENSPSKALWEQLCTRGVAGKVFAWVNN